MSLSSLAPAKARSPVTHTRNKALGTNKISPTTGLEPEWRLNGYRLFLHSVEFSEVVHTLQYMELNNFPSHVDTEWGLGSSRSSPLRSTTLFSSVAFDIVGVILHKPNSYLVIQNSGARPKYHLSPAIWFSFPGGSGAHQISLLLDTQTGSPLSLLDSALSSLCHSQLHL